MCPLATSGGSFIWTSNATRIHLLSHDQSVLCESVREKGDTHHPEAKLNAPRPTLIP